MGIGEILPDLGEKAEEPGHARIDGIALFSQPDGRFEQLGPFQATPTAMHFGHEPDIARNADGPPAGYGLAEAERLSSLIEEQVGCRGRRRCFAAIDGGRCAGCRIMADKEAAATNAGALRFNHGQREHHGHGGIGCRAARPQDFLAGCCGARIRCGHHAGDRG